MFDLVQKTPLMNLDASRSKSNHSGEPFAVANELSWNTPDTRLAEQAMELAGEVRVSISQSSEFRIAVHCGTDRKNGSQLWCKALIATSMMAVRKSFI